jgi:transaldolase/glucose-6-phosphate isomerase
MDVRGRSRSRPGAPGIPIECDRSAGPVGSARPANGCNRRGLAVRHPYRWDAAAHAKLAYQLYKKLFSGERWRRLAPHGAQTQRLLWESTGTKNKAYSDVLYVEELIGLDTVSTIPPATMDAFRDHGRLRQSLAEDVAGAHAVMNALPALCVSIDAVTGKLVEDGVRLFIEAADRRYAAVQGRLSNTP